MTDRNAFQRLLRHPATAWVILLASFVLTAAAWYISDRFICQRAQDRFIFQVADVKAAIARRMLEYEVVLHGGVGLFASSVNVERHEWRTYAENMHLDHHYPGIQGFGFSLVIPATEREKHERQIRADGFPQYRVMPEGERDPYTSIIYLEPFGGRNLRAFGYDMFSEPVRRAAMERARKTGQAALSGRVTLVQETETDMQHGILMYVPFYRNGLPHDTVEQRLANLVGFVYAPFRMRDLMHGILGAGQGDIDFELYDGTVPSEGTLLYKTASGPLQYGNFAFRKDFDNLSQMEIAGRVWSLYLYAPPGFISGAEQSQPLVVAVGGVLVDLLLFFIIGSIARQEKRAEALAEEMTTDLRRSNADLEQFSYAISHDMRQPLRMISSYLQLIEMNLSGQLDEEKRGYFNFAIEGAKRIDHMLVALLEYSRVGRKGEPPGWADSRALLDEVLQFLQPAIAEAQARVDIAGEWPRIFASHDEILRLLQNLIGNAVKYRVAGRIPEVTVTSEVIGHEWHLCVADNGAGIIPDQIKRLFQVFQRLQSREAYEGTGIGLALCRKIAEHHKGRIWAESEGEGKGSKFYVALPMLREEAV